MKKKITKKLFSFTIKEEDFFSKIKNKINPAHKDYDPRLHYLVEKHVK